MRPIQSANAKVVVTGDVTAQQVESGLAFPTQWEGPPRPWGSQARGEQAKPGIYLVDKPGPPSR